MYIRRIFFERKSASKSIPYYQNVLFVVVSKSHQDKAMNTRQKAIIESLKMQYLSSRSWILFCNFFFFSTTLVIFSSSSCALTSKSVIKSSDSTLRVWRPLPEFDLGLELFGNGVLLLLMFLRSLYEDKMHKNVTFLQLRKLENTTWSGLVITQPVNWDCKVTW